MMIVTDPPIWSGGARWTITYVYFGSTSNTRYVESISEADAHQVIGANVAAGFEAVLYTHDSADRELRTPGGSPMRVVTISGFTGVVSALAFIREDNREHSEPADAAARRVSPQAVADHAPRTAETVRPVRGADELRVSAYLGRLGVAM